MNNYMKLYEQLEKSTNKNVFLLKGQIAVLGLLKAPSLMQQLKSLVLGVYKLEKLQATQLAARRKITISVEVENIMKSRVSRYNIFDETNESHLVWKYVSRKEKM